MNLDDFVALLEEKSGMSPLKFSDEGVISFAFNGDFLLNIETSDNNTHLNIHAKIGTLPHKNRENCLKSLLDANLFGQKTQGASLGTEAQEVYLFRSFPLKTLEFDYFLDALIGFMQAQQEWTLALEENTFTELQK